MTRSYRKYSHVTNAMQDAAAKGVVLQGHTKCPQCGKWIHNSEIINGALPVHYLIGKIPCGWRDEAAAK
jgi:hypothetical protein